MRTVLTLSVAALGATVLALAGCTDSTARPSSSTFTGCSQSEYVTTWGSQMFFRQTAGRPRQ